MKKIALITGASGGIGRAIALSFAESGYAVVLAYHKNLPAVERLIRDLPSGTDYLTFSCDLTDASAVALLINSIHQRMGTVSVLVNCAGVALPQMLFNDTSDEQYHYVFDRNVLSAMRLTRLLTDDLRSQRGSVVNISSMWGITGASCEVVYSASKAALIGFTKALAKELAPSDVTVNAVAPGLIPTDMNRHLSFDDLEAFRAETPLNRLGTPEDVARTAVFLAESRFITGQVICCDGGISI